MYLPPQHFQAQNRYFEQSVHFATPVFGETRTGWQLANSMVRVHSSICKGMRCVSQIAGH